MEIKYEKEQIFGSFTQLIVFLIGLGAFVAIPTAIVWGAIYATTLTINNLLGG